LRNSTIVDATRKFVETHTVAAKLLFWGRQIQLSQIRYCLYTNLGKFLAGNLARSRQLRR
jgi:hypothetical protein